MKVHRSALVKLCVPATIVVAIAALYVFWPRAVSVTSAAAKSPPPWNDSYGDGTPDFLRLDAADRLAFRSWFAFLAEAQYFTNQPPAEIDDCAALIRFAYREALRRHDGAWASALRLPAIPPMPAVAGYSYPRTPLGANLFRVRAGAEMSPDAFGQFADAEVLRTLNAQFVSRDLRRARPGDLLFYRQGSQRLPYHAMIFVGPSQITAGNERWIVYHTGPDGSRAGEIRRVTVNELMRHPDARWRPVPQNRAFLGVYRWNILRGGE